ncbi:MAG: carbon-nitrogen hydrolase family protein [Spirochaetales bacterium]|nr:carbon-nitrogen hydrolase family protein [Spirochaetales bacterium]
MSNASINIATAQFPVSANISRDLSYIKKLTHSARRENADIIHFPETCLGGYAGTDFKTWANYNWDEQRNAENIILELAKKLEIGIIYGTNYRVTDSDIRNSIIYISKEGKPSARYDKCFCTEQDLKHYTSGKHFSSFNINSFKCGLLICYDLRFPELYREYKKLKVDIIFQSFYNSRFKGRTIHTSIMRPTIQTRAATNYFYISASNSCAYYQSWPSVFILPDGTIKSSCIQHRTGLIFNTVSAVDKYYDASGLYRDRAMAGILYSE